MPIHSLLFINTKGNVIYSKYFQDNDIHDYNARLFYEQKLFKLTAPNWGRISTIPGAITVNEIRVVYQLVGDMIVFAAGTDDVDETLCKILSHCWYIPISFKIVLCLFIVRDVLVTIEKVLFDVVDQKITEALFLVPENYGKSLYCIEWIYAIMLVYRK